MDRSEDKSDVQISVPKPLGIFWDIENCPIPLTASASGVVSRIRRFIAKRHPECSFAKEFVVATDTRRLTDQITNSLNNNGIVISHVNADAKNASDDKLQEHIYHFIDTFAEKSPILVVITGDINFRKTIQFARTKGIVVVLIFGEFCSQDLKNSSNESYYFSKIIDGVEEVANGSDGPKIGFVKISDLPKEKPIKDILKLLSRLLDNCGGKPVNYCDGNALIEFRCFEDAFKAFRRFNGYKIYGKACNLLPITDGLNQCPLLQEFNICKSVVRGLAFKSGQNLKELVTKLIKDWECSEIEEEIITNVEPVEDFLVLTVITPEANQQLLSCAKRYLTAESGIQWTDAKDYQSIGGDIRGWCAKPAAEQVSDDRRSVIKGMSTRSDQNVTKLIKDLVNSWNDELLNGNLIVSVERNTKQLETSLKNSCNLFVTAISAVASKQLVKGAKRYIPETDRSKWTAYKHKFQTSEDLKSVIKGMDTKNVQNITIYVRNFVNQWRDIRCRGEFIVSVERNTSQNRASPEDKCNLFVTATTPQTSRALIRGAKHYINADHNIIWTAYEPKVNYRNRFGSIGGDSDSDDSHCSFYSMTSSASLVSNATNDSRIKKQTLGNQCKDQLVVNGRMSIITGLVTKNGENVVKTVRKLVSNWKESYINGNMIEKVERDPIFGQNDGKIPLLVTAFSPEISKAMVSAAQKHLTSDSGIKWTEWPTKSKKISEEIKIQPKLVDNRPPLLPFPRFAPNYYPMLQHFNTFGHFPQPIYPLAHLLNPFAMPLHTMSAPFPLINRNPKRTEPLVLIKSKPSNGKDVAQGSSQQSGDHLRNRAHINPDLNERRASIEKKAEEVQSDTSTRPKSSVQTIAKTSSNERLSIITGMKTICGDDVTRIVRRMIMKWKDSSCNGNFIVAVEQNSTSTVPFLEVWTKYGHQTNALLAGAKIHLKPHSGIIWSHSLPKTEPKTRTETTAETVRPSASHPNKMLVICGQKTTHNEDVLQVVRYLVTDLFKGRIIAKDVVEVTRDYRWKARNGTAMLFVTVVDSKVKDLILDLAKSLEKRTDIQFNDYNGFKH